MHLHEHRFYQCRAWLANRAVPEDVLAYALPAQPDGHQG